MVYLWESVNAISILTFKFKGTAKLWKYQSYEEEQSLFGMIHQSHVSAEYLGEYYFKL